MIIWAFLVSIMIIKSIILNNFRNYSHLNLNLNPKMNVFIGKNAEGKTNILEGICVLSLTKTYKSGVEPNLITFGKEKAKLNAKVKKDGFVNSLEIILEKNNKKIKVNNKEVKKTSEYISNLNIIMFTPDDLDIIKGSPHIRRNLINIQLSQISKKYLNTYNEYNKILKMRNEYLKLLLTSSLADKKYLEIITEKLIEKSIIIYIERKKYIDFIDERINSIYKAITNDECLSVKYKPNIEFSSFEEEKMKEELAKVFSKNYKKELNYGMTLFGPHRDEFEFFLNDRNLKYFGSQGQQKMAVLSFKLAEIDVFKKYSDNYPILLLDDIFSELDIEKRNRLLNYINRDVQSIITTTDLKNIRKCYLNNSYIFEIKKGEIERRQ